MKLQGQRVNYVSLMSVRNEQVPIPVPLLSVLLFPVEFHTLVLLHQLMTARE